MSMKLHPPTSSPRHVRPSPLAIGLPPPMKKSVRPLFTLLLFVAVATAFTSRLFLLRRRPPPDPFLFNSTLLRLAALDLAADNSRREVDQLLDFTLLGGSARAAGRGVGQAHYRTISSWRRYHPAAADEVLPRAAAAMAARIPVQLRSAKYRGFWPEFRRSLRAWFRNKRYQPEVMAELVDLLKRPLDRHYGVPASGRQYSSCAVVGNSGILLKNDDGALIDGHEVVIRLNNARIRGYERHAGSKTSMAFVNSNILHLCGRRESCFCHPYGEKVPMVMYICQAIHFMDYAFCNGSHKAPLLITDARFDLLCTRLVKYYSLKRFVEETGKPPEEWAAAHEGSMFHYSSGMQAVMLAMGICDKVSMFGFGKSTAAKHHYHTNQKAELHLHDYEAEYSLYRDLVDRPQEIPFLKDSGLQIPPLVIHQ